MGSFSTVHGDLGRNMIKSHKVFNWLVATYCAAFLFYLFNLAAPPHNMPVIIVMAVIAVVAGSLSRTKKRGGIALLMAIMALLLIYKEQNAGVSLKSKVDSAHQKSQQLHQ